MKQKMTVLLFKEGDNIGSGIIANLDDITLPKTPFPVTHEYEEIIGNCVDIYFKDGGCYAEIELENTFYLGYLHEGTRLDIRQITLFTDQRKLVRKEKK